MSRESYVRDTRVSTLELAKVTLMASLGASNVGVRRTNSRPRFNVKDNGSVPFLGRPVGSPVCIGMRLDSLTHEDDTDQLIGSASFRFNPAWGRFCEQADVQCVLTRRTRLQYMRCNGVGGSTCRSRTSRRFHGRT